jgi:hypothetical protein
VLSSPDNEIVRQGRDPERDLKSLQKRFARVTRRFERRRWRKNFVQGLRAQLFAACAVFAAAFAGLILSPFTPIDTLKHLLAFPNCASAQALGLTPSRRGQPGYWSHLDRDNDGVACEWWR